MNVPRGILICADSRNILWHQFGRWRPRRGLPGANTANKSRQQERIDQKHNAKEDGEAADDTAVGVQITLRDLKLGFRLGFGFARGCDAASGLGR